MKNIIRALIEVPLYFISGLFIRKKNRVIFGAWNGDKYADNSKYMLEYLKDNKDYELIWCGKKEVEDELPKYSNIKFVEYGSLASYYYALTSKYAFITHSQNDICSFNVLKGAKIVQLWHGIGIKNLVPSKASKDKLSYRIRTKIRSIIRKYDYFICSSEVNKERNLIAFESYGINEKNVINSGQPRNDLFFNFNSKDVRQLREEYSKKYSIPIDKKVITYMPTFRKDKSGQFLFSELPEGDKDKLKKILKKYNTILLEKVHHKDRGNNKKINTKNKYFINIGEFNDIDTQELLLITDLLITDYSSCYLDYILLDRPVIHFSYDYEQYIIEDKGLYYDYSNIVAGDIVKNFEDLIKSIDKNLSDSRYGKELRDAVRKKMMKYEQGVSSKIISKNIGLI